MLYSKMRYKYMPFYPGLTFRWHGDSQHVPTLASPLVTYATVMCLSFTMDADYTNGWGDGWHLYISQYGLGDTVTPSITLGHFIFSDILNRGMVSLPPGNYRIIFSLHGKGYRMLQAVLKYVRLRDILVTYGACSDVGKFIWVKYN